MKYWKNLKVDCLKWKKGNQSIKKAKRKKGKKVIETSSQGKKSIEWNKEREKKKYSGQTSVNAAIVSRHSNKEENVK